MTKKYQYIFRAVIAVLFAILGVFIPSAVFKVIFAFLAIFMLALNFRKFTVFLIIFVAIFFLLPGVSIAVYKSRNFERDFSNFWMYLYNDNEYKKIWKYDFSRVYIPDMEIKSSNQISFRGSAFELVFDEESNKISIPSELTYYYDGNKIIFDSRDYLNAKMKIIIGTKNNDYTSLFVDASYLEMKGSSFSSKYIDLDVVNLKVFNGINSKNVNINSNVVYLTSFFNSDFIDIDGVSVKLNNFLIDSETFNIKSDVLDISGEFYVKKLNFEGTSINFDLKLHETENFYSSGTTINGSLEYLDNWEEDKRSIKLYGEIGDVEIITRKDNKGEFDIRSDKGILINRID
ncbi:MAG: hypothetical protein PWP28_2278 [Oceanotoga sp.]|jgi:hypothetical protein|uniref:hypothetical protein n=1 Tax=Oceanotoga sp. TaxID=2108366 RepID=UPI00264C998E|nr:hypothetical protein [Oceanotoga sp.]MDN5343398.1 hypothetical protein [Oceanotoga sp.]